MFILYEARYTYSINLLNDLTQHGVKVEDGPYVSRGHASFRQDTLLSFKGHYGDLEFKRNSSGLRWTLNIFVFLQDPDYIDIAGYSFAYDLQIGILKDSDFYPHFESVWNDLVITLKKQNSKPIEVPQRIKDVRKYYREYMRKCSLIPITPEDYE